MPRETEEEMMAKVAEMQGGKVDEGNKVEVDKDNDKEVEGVQLEQAGTNVMPHVQQETGLKSEEGNEKKGDEDKDGNVADTDKDPDKVATQDSPEDILTLSNADKKIKGADKRVKDAQTKMHQKASEASESNALLEEANLKVKSYETIIAKSGTNSTEGIKAQQNIDDTNLQAVADLQALEKEYPEIAKPLISAFSKIQGQLDSMMKNQTASVESMNESNEKILSEMHFKRIGEFHPDYAEIAKSKELTDWINGLSTFERSAALRVKGGDADADADESISMLDKFKEDTGYGSNNGNKNTDENTDNKTKDAANLELAKSKVSPTFSKKKELKLKDNKGQLTVTEMRNMAPTKENEERILQAMASGQLVS